MAALFNGVALAVLIAILALVALVTKPPPPPNVAEFAPQAVEQIVDAPSNQSSRFGSGAGEGASGTADVPSGGQGTIRTARVHRCVGNPPRQIEDPQSPPCVAHWEGDNGGATWKGVTRDEIRVVAYHEEGFPNEAAKRFAEFFNSRFEFYGRRIHLVFEPFLSANPTPESQRAQAAKVDEELGAFASLPAFNSADHATTAYFDELARRKILSVDTQTSFRTEANDFRPNDPFQWHLFTLDKYQRNQAEWICKSLSRKPAIYGGADVQTSTRVFGVLLENKRGGAADPSALIDGLGRCAEQPKTVIEYQSRNGGTRGVSEDVALAKLKADGVTSIICYCYHSAMDSASRQAYSPEWILSQEWDSYPLTLSPPDQRTHVFGLTHKNKINGLTDRPWYWAAREADPEFVAELEHYETRDYLAFLHLASGIQMAGPNLTPYTFRDGLLKTKFPNPGASASPYYQATVGFGQGDHSFFQDLAMIWWDDVGGPAQNQGISGWCYIRKGVRYGLGQWPRDDQPFFDRDQPCR